MDAIRERSILATEVRQADSIAREAELKNDRREIISGSYDKALTAARKRNEDLSAENRSLWEGGVRASDEEGRMFESWKASEESLSALHEAHQERTSMFRHQKRSWDIKHDAMTSCINDQDIRLTHHEKAAVLRHNQLGARITESLRRG